MNTPIKLMMIPALTLNDQSHPMSVLQDLAALAPPPCEYPQFAYMELRVVYTLNRALLKHLPQQLINKIPIRLDELNIPFLCLNHLLVFTTGLRQRIINNCAEFWALAPYAPTELNEAALWLDELVEQQAEGLADHISLHYDPGC